MNEREEIGSLCSGYGGLDRALSAVLRLPVAWHAEIEKLTDAKTGKVRDNPVCQVLDARYPGLPNHGDITAIDWTSLARPRALAAGFPCTTVSSAGLQLADADPRWLWPAVRAGIDVLRPEWLAIENVANLVSIQKGELWRGILADLAALGYSVAWGIFGACLAEVSGCHHRHRVFALARLSSTPTETRWTGKACGVPPRRAPWGLPAGARDGAGRGEGDATYWEGRQERHKPNGLPLGAQVALLSTCTAGDSTKGAHREGRTFAEHSRTGDLVAAVAYTPAGQLLPTPDARSGDANNRGLPSVELAQARMNQGRRHLDDAIALLPTPITGDGTRGITNAGRTYAGHDRTTDLAMPSAVQPQNFGIYTWAVERWAAVHGAAPAPTAPGPRGGVQLRAQFSEWMMGLAPGFVTDVLPRKEALHAIGNGVLPLQAYAAFGHLLPLLTA